LNKINRREVLLIYKRSAVNIYGCNTGYAVGGNGTIIKTTNAGVGIMK